MLRRWGRNVWRFLEPWLAEMVWLDPAAAAVCLNPERPQPPVLRLRRVEPRKEHSVA